MQLFVIHIYRQKYHPSFYWEKHNLSLQQFLFCIKYFKVINPGWSSFIFPMSPRVQLGFTLKFFLVKLMVFLQPIAYILWAVQYISYGNTRYMVPKYGIQGSLMMSMWSRNLCLLSFSENRSAIFSQVDLSFRDNI